MIDSLKRLLPIAAKLQSPILTFTAVALTVGMIALIVDLTWFHVPATLRAVAVEEGHKPLASVAAWALSIGLVGGLLSLALLHHDAPNPAAADYSQRMFGRSLVGLGFVLMLDATVNVIAVAGFAKSGVLPVLFHSASGTLLAPKIATNALHAGLTMTNAVTPGKPTVPGTTEEKPGQEPDPEGKLDSRQRNLMTALQLLFALGFTVMGALSFFAKSLWEKMKAVPAVQYDTHIFGAGLWFRIGEAIVFTLVIFVALLFNKQADAAGWMPFIALIIGLSVKAAEDLIAGISRRLLNAINGLIG